MRAGAKGHGDDLGVVDSAARDPPSVHRSRPESKRSLSKVVRRPAAGWEEREQTLGDAFAELREICAEEGYELQLPEREDRSNSFAEAITRRHGR